MLHRSLLLHLPEDFGVGGFDCIVYCGDLTGGSGPGAEETEGVVFGADVHGG